ncbi:MAG: hypothetical protein KZY61_11145 [Clostridiaceae bacterium]|nr:hypothetical protein [Clostridiaceae bacterium]MBW4860212.1 hypothetical protein [Clostridiaceae bacterium]MBW4869189.1 hypothetical protein [Clostridiaceae bacterium]
MKKKVISGLLVLFIGISISGNIALANEGGGWSEDTGYYTENTNLNSYSVRSARSTRSTPKHTGKRERKEIKGTTHFRAHGWTTWVGVRHYTRAQMQDRKGRMLTDSGRKWGTNGTEAVSPYLAFSPYRSDKAITRYGRGK